ncbi:MAG: DUF4238 domain-containing protein [Pseudomonadota bacterium]
MPPAQNQHYVPKFILRNFLSNKRREQVHVFSKKTHVGFTTSIRNIMAERRFYDFRIGADYVASFEESICRFEGELLPAYRNLVDRRQFDGTPEEKAYLAALVAFQFLRTRAQRDMFVQAEEQLADHLSKRGASLDDIKNYEPLTEEALTHLHIHHMRESLSSVAKIVSMKDFLLLSAPAGRSFYLSDNPVSIHNSKPNSTPYGNLGLACKGIELYMPLCSDLALALWCPSLLKEIQDGEAEQKRLMAKIVLSLKLSSEAGSAEIKRSLESVKSETARVQSTLKHFADETPILLPEESMDFQNSLQISQAREHLVCPQGDFELARRFAEEYPDHQGRKLSIG